VSGQAEIFCKGCSRAAREWVTYPDGRPAEPYCLHCVNGGPYGPRGAFATYPIRPGDTPPPPATPAGAVLLEQAGQRPGEQLRARLLTAAEVVKRPPPEALVDGLLYRDTLALLYGSPGCFKSFLALDLALSIDGGRAWGGRATVQGPVLYVCAEGLAGMGSRIQAWEQAYGHARTGEHGRLYVLPGPVHLLQPNDVAALVDVVPILGPRLVVLDTLNRCLAGGDENNSRDMGQALDALDRVRQAGTSGLVLHHSDKAGRNYRGHSSLEGAVDTVLRIERAGKAITLTTQKQKDAAEAAPIQLRTVRHELESGTSLTLYCHEGVGSTEAEPAPHEAVLLELLGSTFGSDGASASQLLKTSELADRSFYRALNALVRRGAIENKGTPTRTRYVLVQPKAPPEQQVLP
jgi:AAA domain